MFGSRARGIARRSSDLDLAISSPEATPTDWAELCDALENTPIIYELDIVRDAAIQRFEFTFELVWKTLQLYLEHEGLESSGPRAVLKRAFVMRLSLIHI